MHESSVPCYPHHRAAREAVTRTAVAPPVKLLLGTNPITRSLIGLGRRHASRSMKMAFEGSGRLGPNVRFIRDRGLLWENADG
jgi:hypothetical protein